MGMLARIFPNTFFHLNLLNLADSQRFFLLGFSFGGGIPKPKMGESYSFVAPTLLRKEGVLLQEPLGTIKGRVTTPQGDPLPSLEVKIKDSFVVDKTDKEGRYHLQKVPLGEQKILILQGDQVLFSVPIYVSLYPEQIHTFVLEYTPPPLGPPPMGILKGRVTVEGKESGVEGVKIYLENENITIFGTSDKEGIYIFKEVPMGLYRMTFTKEKFFTLLMAVEVKGKKENQQNVSLKKQPEE